MPSWTDANPLIALIVTTCASVFGLIWAARTRTGIAASATSTAVIGGAVGGALAEKGEAQNLQIAIAQLTDEIRALRKTIEDALRDHEIARVRQDARDDARREFEARKR